MIRYTISVPTRRGHVHGARDVSIPSNTNTTHAGGARTEEKPRGKIVSIHRGRRERGLYGREWNPANRPDTWAHALRA